MRNKLIHSHCKTDRKAHDLTIEMRQHNNEGIASEKSKQPDRSQMPAYEDQTKRYAEGSKIKINDIIKNKEMQIDPAVCKSDCSIEQQTSNTEKNFQNRL